MVVVFDPTTFRDTYTQFANRACFPDVTLGLWFDLATSFIDPATPRWSPMLDDKKRNAALGMMTAHIGALFVQAMNGQMPGVITSAQIDKVQVTLQPPESDSAFRFYLNQSPYGQMLLALLSVASVGGFYQPGGIGARAGFR